MRTAAAQMKIATAGRKKSVIHDDQSSDVCRANGVVFSPFKIALFSAFLKCIVRRIRL